MTATALAAFASPVVDRDSPYRLSLDGTWRFGLAPRRLRRRTVLRRLIMTTATWDEIGRAQQLAACG